MPGNGFISARTLIALFRRFHNSITAGGRNNLALAKSGAGQGGRAGGSVALLARLELAVAAARRRRLTLAESVAKLAAAAAAAVALLASFKLSVAAGGRRRDALTKRIAGQAHAAAAAITGFAGFHGSVTALGGNRLANTIKRAGFARRTTGPYSRRLASFSAFQDSVAAIRIFDDTRRRTAVPASRIPVVALFSGLPDVVSAAFNFAVDGTTVIVRGVPVIALFAGLLDVVSAKFGFASRRATIVVGRASVITFFRSIQSIITAIRRAYALRGLTIFPLRARALLIGSVAYFPTLRFQVSVSATGSGRNTFTGSVAGPSLLTRRINRGLIRIPIIGIAGLTITTASAAAALTAASIPASSSGPASDGSALPGNGCICTSALIASFRGFGYAISAYASAVPIRITIPIPVPVPVPVPVPGPVPITDRIVVIGRDTRTRRPASFTDGALR